MDPDLKLPPLQHSAQSREGKSAPGRTTHGCRKMWAGSKRSIFSSWQEPGIRCENSGNNTDHLYLPERNQHCIWQARRAQEQAGGAGGTLVGIVKDLRNDRV